MNILTQLVPIIGEVLALSLKLADIVEKAEDISAEDKEALKAEIRKARDGVTFWDEEDGN